MKIPTPSWRGNWIDVTASGKLLVRTPEIKTLYSADGKPFSTARRTLVQPFECFPTGRGAVFLGTIGSKWWTSIL